MDPDPARNFLAYSSNVDLIDKTMNKPACDCAVDDAILVRGQASGVCSSCGRPYRANRMQWLPHKAGPEYRTAGRFQGVIAIVCGLSVSGVDALLSFDRKFSPALLVVASVLIAVGLAVAISPKIGDALMGNNDVTWAKVVGYLAIIFGMIVGFALVSLKMGLLGGAD